MTLGPAGETAGFRTRAMAQAPDFGEPLWAVGIFGRLFGDKGSGKTVEVAPGLEVQVVVHEVKEPDGPVPLWSCVTKGLSRRPGQREVVLSIRRGPKQGANDLPEDVLLLLGMIDDVAGQGKLVDAGTVTELGARGLLRSTVRGVLWVRAGELPGIELSGPSLAGVLLVGEELAIARHCPSRVLARLGQGAARWPHPVWSDPDRRSPAPAGDTVLEGVPTIRALSAYARFHEKQVWLRFDREGHAALVRGLKRVALGTPVFLLLGIDPRSAGCLVWQPGQTGVVTHTPDGKPAKRGAPLSACFLADVPGTATDELQLVEDGASLLLRHGLSDRLRKAILKGRPVTLDGEDGLLVHLEPLEEVEESDAELVRVEPPKEPIPARSPTRAIARPSILGESATIQLPEGGIQPLPRSQAPTRAVPRPERGATPADGSARPRDSQRVPVQPPLERPAGPRAQPTPDKLEKPRDSQRAPVQRGAPAASGRQAKPPAEPRVAIKGVDLRIAEALLQERCQPEALEQFVSDLEAKLNELAKLAPVGGEVRARVELFPDQLPVIELEGKPADALSLLLEGARDKLAMELGPAVEGYVAFQVRFEVRPPG